jgi:hypothetical protein
VPVFESGYYDKNLIIRFKYAGSSQRVNKLDWFSYAKLEAATNFIKLIYHKGKCLFADFEIQAAFYGHVEYGFWLFYKK